MTASEALNSPASEADHTAIDAPHLERMTLGDRALEREILEIFSRQTTLALERIVGAEPALVTAAAHTLKGSARGIGAWRVAEAAERLEGAASALCSQAEVEAAIDGLRAAVIEASAAITARLNGLPADH